MVSGTTLFPAPPTSPPSSLAVPRAPHAFGDQGAREGESDSPLTGHRIMNHQGIYIQKAPCAPAELRRGAQPSAGKSGPVIDLTNVCSLNTTCQGTDDGGQKARDVPACILFLSFFLFSSSLFLSFPIFSFLFLMTALLRYNSHIKCSLWKCTDQCVLYIRRVV